MSSSAPLPQPPSKADIQRALDEFDRTPLFMRSLPSEGDGDGEENVALEALKSLIYEGTPDEVAQNFKDQGNDYFRGRRWREALGFYTQGLDAKPEDPKLRESLLLNRAACNLELQNYRKVLTDTSLVLSSSPTASKAYFRAGQALTKLARYAEALDALQRCLALQPSDTGVQRALQEARRGHEAVERKEREKREKEQLRKALDKALDARGIVSVRTQSPPPQDAYPAFDPAYLLSPSSPSSDATQPYTPPPPTTPLLIPILLLYPLEAQTDLITAFPESSTFLDQLRPVLDPPPPWDTRGKYALRGVGIYVVTIKGRVLKLGLGRKLLDVWPAAAGTGGEGKGVGRGDGVVCRDGWVEVYVLPKGEEEKKWVEQMKLKVGGGGKR